MLITYTRLFIILVTVMNWAWGIAWSKKDDFNILVKFAFFGFAIWGTIILVKG